MRIAHISDCYLPRTGGIETQVRNLAQAELQAGHEPFVVTATPANAKELSIPNEHDRGVPIHRLAVRMPGDLPVTPHIGSKLREVVDGNCDVVHIHGGLVSPFAWPALRTVSKMGIPTVISVHSMWPQHAATRLGIQALRIKPQPHVIWTTVSRAAVVPLQAALGKDHKIRVLPNGIDVDHWKNTGPVPEYQRGDTVTIVSVARLAPRKRIRPLIDILSDARKLVPEGIPLKALIIGDGPERKQIAKSIARDKLDWIELCGTLSHDEILKVYDDASMFVASAHLESFGIAALEARTAGVPIVGFQDSGVSEAVTNGEEGLLVGDDDQMASAIADLATNHKYRSEIMRHNRLVPPPFGWSECVTQAVNLYELAISGN